MRLKYGYGLLKRLRRGVKLNIYLTMKCNLNCSYCCWKWGDGKMPIVKDRLTLRDWQQRIRRFPMKIREISISGGDPMGVDYFAELVNWCLNEGYFVNVFTNLSLKRYVIKPSYRLKFSATYHENLDRKIFCQNLRFYREKYRVDIDEIRTNEFPDSMKKKECKVEDAIRDLPECNCLGFIYIPDGALFTEGLDIIEYFKNIKLSRALKAPKKFNYLQEILNRWKS